MRPAALLVAALAASTWAAGALAAPSKTELSDARAWLDKYVSAQAPSRAFSFLSNGTISDTILRRWKCKCAVLSSGDGTERCMLSFRDPSSGLELTYTTRHFTEEAAVELLLEIANTGAVDSPLIEAVRVLDVLLPISGDRCLLHRALGESNSERSFMPVVETLPSGMEKPRIVRPVGGRSSDTEMPFFNVQTRGGGLIVAIGWAGQWEARFQREESGALRIICGQQDSCVRLHPGERIRTPRVLLQFWSGDDPIRGNNLFRQWMLARNLPRRNDELVMSPICGSVGKVAPDGSYEPAHIGIMQPLAKHGFEVFWSDMDPQQWYPIGFPEGTGTWEPDPVKYPRGLKPVGDAARAAGLEYLLWFEPERVVHGTRVDQLHPEWVTYPKNDPKANGLFRLDIPEAREWLTDYIDEQVTAAGLGWVRWDFNMGPLKYWRQNDAPDRKGMTEMRHVEGLYAMWQDLMRRHPGLVVDICASGGRRIDFETLRYGLPLWHSDMQCFGARPEADQLQNGGLNRWLPLHGCGNFGLEPSYLFRSAMTTGNILVDPRVFALLDTADPQANEAIRRTITVYKKVRPYMLGDFHPLFPHDVSASVWYGYQFHRPDLDAGCAIVFRRPQCPNAQTTIELQGVKRRARYEVTFEDTSDARILSGDALRAFAIVIPSAPGSAILYYRRIETATPH